MRHNCIKVRINVLIRLMKKLKYVIPVFILLILIFLGWFAVTQLGINKPHKIEVVAAENFWGSLVKQIGGNKVSVFSVITNPNIDPHEYESNVADSIAITKANLLIVNGEGYDDWAIKDYQASNNKKTIYLNISKDLNLSSGQNPHLWYNPNYVNVAINSMADDLSRIAPKDRKYFQKNLTTLKNSLAKYQDIMNYIKLHYSGTKIGSTESIFDYPAAYMGLNLISPNPFMNAVSEGIDPPTSSLLTFEEQINSKEIKLLIYNTQTITPLTFNLKQLALKNKIPVIGISETMSPTTTTFQNWMYTEFNKISKTLQNEQ